MTDAPPPWDQPSYYYAAAVGWLSDAKKLYDRDHFDRATAAASIATAYASLASGAELASREERTAP